MWFVAGLPATAASWSSSVETSRSFATLLGEGDWSPTLTQVWSTYPHLLPQSVLCGTEAQCCFPCHSGQELVLCLPTSQTVQEKSF